jgi:hypothetical protein
MRITHARPACITDRQPSLFFSSSKLIRRASALVTPTARQRWTIRCSVRRANRERQTRWMREIDCCILASLNIGCVAEG